MTHISELRSRVLEALDTLETHEQLRAENAQLREKLSALEGRGWVAGDLVLDSDRVQYAYLALLLLVERLGSVNIVGMREATATIRALHRAGLIEFADRLQQWAQLTHSGREFLGKHAAAQWRPPVNTTDRHVMGMAHRAAYGAATVHPHGLTKWVARVESAARENEEAARDDLRAKLEAKGP